MGVLTKSKWAPPRLPAIKVAEPTVDDIVNQAATIARPTKDVESEERKEVINLACEAIELATAGDGTEAETHAYSANRIPGSYQNRQAAEDLVTNLHSARNSTERVVVLGQAALCQWASS